MSGAPTPLTASVGAVRTTALTAQGMGAPIVLSFYSEEMQPIAHAQLGIDEIEAFAYDMLAVALAARADHGTTAFTNSPSVLSFLAATRMRAVRA